MVGGTTMSERELRNLLRASFHAVDEAQRDMNICCDRAKDVLLEVIAEISDEKKATHLVVASTK
jgi:hypothetical protein